MTSNSSSDFTLAAYNPAWLAKDELVSQFVVRGPLLDRVLADLRTATAETGATHHLLVGQRGMGKTTFLRRLRYALEDEPELASRWLPLTFPEEQYNVTRMSNFWLNCLDSLSDALEQRDRGEESRRIDQFVDGLTDRDENSLAQRAREMLLNWCRENKRGLVLLVDNIDLILDKLDSQQHWHFRETLSHEPRLAVVGTSVTPPAAVYDHDDAFYDFFLVHEFRGLTQADARKLLGMLAQRGGAPQVAEAIDRDPGRLATLHLLTGGNPRTLILLYQVLAASDEGNVIRDVEHLLDQSTPLYKARIESLPPQAQQVFDHLALHWDPVTAGELADGLRMEVNKVSAQLDRMVKEGLVEKVPFPPGTKNGFQVSERFFNIWYLMRSSRRVRRRLMWLVEFLKLFYGSTELADHARRWLEKWPTDAKENRIRHAELSLAFASAVCEPALSKALERHGLRVLVEISHDTRLKLREILDLDGEDAHLRALAEHLTTLAELHDRVLSLQREWPDCTVEEFWDLLGGSPSMSFEEKKNTVAQLQDLSTKRTQKIVEQLRQEFQSSAEVFGIDPCRRLWLAISSGKMHRLDDIEGADDASLGAADSTLPAIARATALEKAFSEDMFNDLYGMLAHCDSAYPIIVWAKAAAKQNMDVVKKRFAVEMVVKLNPNCAEDWRQVGNIYMDQLKLYIEAETAYRKAIALDARDDRAWHRLGGVFEKLNRFEEAEKAYRKAIELDPSKAWHWDGLGNLFQELNRNEEAENAYRQAIEVDSTISWCWHDLGNFLKKQSRQAEAEAAFRKAIELDAKNGWHWDSLGDLFEELNRYEEAENAYRKAVEIDPTNPWPWHDLGKLLQYHLSRYAEAEAAYRKAIELDPNCSHFWRNLGTLFQANLNRFEESADAYRKAIELSPEDAVLTNRLAWLLYTKKGNEEEAEKLARRGVLLMPDNLSFIHTLACIVLRRGNWPEASQLARRFITEGDKELHEKLWTYIVMFFREAVAGGHGRDAVELLDDTGYGERWRPLREALYAAATGDPNYLLRIAPEVRVPAQQILQQLSNQDIKGEPVQGGTSKSRRPKRRKRF